MRTVVPTVTPPSEGGQSQGDGGFDNAQPSSDTPSHGLPSVSPDSIPTSYIRANPLDLPEVSIDTPLTRGKLAEIVVDYALNTLHRDLPSTVPAFCYFKDGSSARASPQEKTYATQSCQLGLMGLGMDRFTPATKVTQAQLAIVLYRLLYDPTYVGGKAPRELPLQTLIADGLLDSIPKPRDTVVSVETAVSVLMKAR